MSGKYGITQTLDETTRVASEGFFIALQRKLYEAQKKYGYTDDWLRCDPDALRRDLIAHIYKGDPLDVAAFCMFLWSRHESVALPQEQLETIGK